MYHRRIRVFDPRQGPAMDKQIEAYSTMMPLASPLAQLIEQWNNNTLGAQSRQE